MRVRAYISGECGAPKAPADQDVAGLAKNTLRWRAVVLPSTTRATDVNSRRGQRGRPC
jgi:hypothetical protein